MKKIGVIIATITVLPLIAIGAYLFAALSVGDTSDEFLTWFVVTFIIMVVILAPLAYISVKSGSGVTASTRKSRRSEGYSFWSGSRNSSFPTGTKIKKYDSEGWRKKNGTNLFKRSGRRSKWDF